MAFELVSKSITAAASRRRTIAINSVRLDEAGRLFLAPDLIEAVLQKGCDHLEVLVDRSEGQRKIALRPVRKSGTAFKITLAKPNGLGSKTGQISVGKALECLKPWPAPREWFQITWTDDLQAYVGTLPIAGPSALDSLMGDLLAPPSEVATVTAKEAENTDLSLELE